MAGCDSSKAVPCGRIDGDGQHRTKQSLPRWARMIQRKIQRRHTGKTLPAAGEPVVHLGAVHAYGLAFDSNWGLSRFRARCRRRTAPVMPRARRPTRSWAA